MNEDMMLLLQFDIARQLCMHIIYFIIIKYVLRIELSCLV